jgi:hypothetical protein
MLLSSAAATGRLMAQEGRAASEATPAASSDDPVALARERYDAGTRAFGQGRFVEAALDYEAAAAEKANAVALYTAALSWERAGAPDRAADDYARAVAATGLPPEQTARTQERLASLNKALGAANVSAPEGWRVQLDANTQVATPATLHGAQGVHTLVARSPTGAIQRVPVVLQPGQTTNASLSLPPPAPAPPRPPPAVDVRRGIGLVALGAAGTALLAALLLGQETIDARDAYNAAPSSETYSHASQLITWTNVTLVAGGTLLAAGLALVLWPSKSSATNSGIPGQRNRPVVFVGVGPQFAGVGGSFR